MSMTFRLLATTGLVLIAGAAVAQTEIRFTHAMSGGNAEALNTIIAAFEAANPGVTVRQITFDDDIYSDNEVPDIYFQWAGFPLSRDVEAGYAMDLTDAMAGGWGDSFLDSAFTAGAGTTVGGRIYMVPLSLDVTNTIWYNAAIFEEYGLTPRRSSPATTNSGRSATGRATSPPGSSLRQTSMPPSGRRRASPTRASCPRSS